MSQNLVIRSADVDGLEISWFAPICSDDFEYLGVPDDHLKSSYEHTREVLLNAERLGFNNILCPSSYQVGQDTLTFAAAMAPQISKLSLLVAVRCGELHPPMLARTLATLDHILKGRLTVNIISSDLPGQNQASAERYQKSREVIQILKQCWTRERLNFDGDFYQFHDLSTEPVQPYQVGGGPLLYFGGMSDDARQLAAEHCDVFLMWPETEDRLRDVMADLSHRALSFDRKLDFGLRVHVIVRETEAEARAYAQKLVSKLDRETGDAIRARALDAKSLGVARQTEMRAAADHEGYVEPHLWTGIGRARSGCGAALVGSAEQVLEKLRRYQQMGIRAFILSGYPHLQECDYFAKLVLPHLKTAKLAEIQGRIPKETPFTPLGRGKRR